MEEGKTNGPNAKTKRLSMFNEKMQKLVDKFDAPLQLEEFKTGNTASKDPNYRANHLMVHPVQIRPVVLSVGDPGRCDTVAKLCEKSIEVKYNREYRLCNMTYEGTEITVVSHGIGGPGAGIAFEELIHLGAKVIIRCGTCGSLKPKAVNPGDLMVSNSCAREDGHSDWTVPQGYPAASDPFLAVELYKTAKKICENVPNKVHCGINLTSGCFYEGPVNKPYTTYANHDVLTCDMENSCLFALGSLRGIRTAAIGTIDGSPFTWDTEGYDPQGNIVSDGKKKMLQVGLKVCKKAMDEIN